MTGVVCQDNLTFPVRIIDDQIRLPRISYGVLICRQGGLPNVSAHSSLPPRSKTGRSTRPPFERSDYQEVFIRWSFLTGIEVRSTRDSLVLMAVAIVLSRQWYGCSRSGPFAWPAETARIREAGDLHAPAGLSTQGLFAERCVRLWVGADG